MKPRHRTRHSLAARLTASPSRPAQPRKQSHRHRLPQKTAAMTDIPDIQFAPETLNIMSW
jgi:hypothetical protein